ncbi:heavy metal translocating P-type ATPase metal-binding domain-containing protein [Puia sp. P3]|uniref:heavy metal translocating P-type ATPase metal-binding domain-containing protein n=1 Tax=Puia sp. P3 TaxID=3423952 RepID=UPI003D66F592
MGTMMSAPAVCSHCGEVCPTDRIRIEDKRFCCEGCRVVYRLLDTNGLCGYYRMNEHPGVSQRMPVRKDKFVFLDDEAMAARLVSFSNAAETHVRLYLPQIHCSSCLYLLENLHRLEEGVVSSRIDFAAREVMVVFDHRRLSLRGVAELLTSLGYEPHISLRELGAASPRADKALVYQLGVAGFCFANIMLLSFPEYLGLDASEVVIRRVFRVLNFCFRCRWCYTVPGLSIFLRGRVCGSIF